MSLDIGLQLPVQAQTRMVAMPWERSAGAEEIVAVAQACDRSGFAYIGVCDHVAIPRERADAMGTEWWEPFSLLSYLAAVTTRVRLLTHVYVPALRHPLLTAKALVTADCLSQGRMILGVGAGHLETEFAAVGADFDSRGSITDEAIDVIRAATVDEWPTYRGAVFDVAEVGVRPRPVQQPVPIWVGGSSAPARRRAAERGDGWLPQGTPRRDLPAMVEHIRAHREAAGVSAPIQLGANHEPIYLGDGDLDLPPFVRRGPAEALAESLQGLADLGCSHAIVFFISRSAGELVEQIEHFGAEVSPLLA